VRRLLEGDAARQLLELVAADNELASQAIDVAQASLRRDDPVQPSGLYRWVDETAFTSW